MVRRHRNEWLEEVWRRLHAQIARWYVDQSTLLNEPSGPHHRCRMRLDQAVRRRLLRAEPIHHVPPRAPRVDGAGRLLDLLLELLDQRLPVSPHLGGCQAHRMLEMQPEVEGLFSHTTFRRGALKQLVLEKKAS